MEFLGDSMDLTLQCCIWNLVYSKLPGKVGVVNIIETRILRREHITFYCQQVWVTTCWVPHEFLLNFGGFLRSSEFWSLGYLNVGAISHLSRSISRLFWVGNTRSQSLSCWLGSMANEGRETSEGCYWSDDLLLGKSWKSSKIGTWKFCVIRKCHHVILFVGLCRSNPLLNWWMNILQYIKNIGIHCTWLRMKWKHHPNSFSAQGEVHLLPPSKGYEMQLALRLVYDINEDLQKLLVQNLEILWNSIESVSELVDVDICSSEFTEFLVLIVRHHQMNLWFYSLTQLKMRSCLRCECKSARWRKGDIKLFHNMFLFNFMI